MAGVRSRYFLLLLSIFQVCHGGGMFELLMVSYYSGCSETFDGPCDIYFTFCFDTPKSNPSINTCAYNRMGDTATYWDNTNLKFGGDVGGIANPMHVPIASFSDPRVMVVMRVMDENRIANDDHKVTVSAILPLNPAATVSTATYTNGQFQESGHTIVYRYRSYCTDSYLGQKCDCKPRNDTTGHYTCPQQTDGKVCLTGWEGTACTQDINECERTPGICGNVTTSVQSGAVIANRTCTNTPGFYACGSTVCPRGWRGDICGIDVDECAEAVTSLCPANTTCTNTPGSYVCVAICPHGWKGYNCGIDVDECAEAVTSLCENNGTCRNVNGSYRCDCPSSWTGPNCTEDANECAPGFPAKPCTALNAECKNLHGSYECVCLKGWRGNDCMEDIDECRENNITCHNGGTCVNYPGSYACTCAESWRGVGCTEDVDECTNSPCQNGASCENSAGSFQCFCANGSIGCVRAETHTGSNNNESNKEDSGLIYWPIILVLIIFLLGIVIVAVVLIRRRRRREDPLDDKYQANIKPETDAHITPFKPNSLNFENSLYHEGRGNRKPRPSDIIESKTKGEATGDPGQSWKVPTAPGPIYHDIDEEDGLKTVVSAGWATKPNIGFAHMDSPRSKAKFEKPEISMPLERMDDFDGETTRKPYFGEPSVFVNEAFDATDEEPLKPRSIVYENAEVNFGPSRKVPTSPVQKGPSATEDQAETAQKTPSGAEGQHGAGRKVREGMLEELRRRPSLQENHYEEFPQNARGNHYEEIDLSTA